MLLRIQSLCQERVLVELSQLGSLFIAFWVLWRLEILQLIRFESPMKYWSSFALKILLAWYWTLVRILEELALFAELWNFFNRNLKLFKWLKIECLFSLFIMWLTLAIIHLILTKGTWFAFLDLVLAKCTLLISINLILTEGTWFTLTNLVGSKSTGLYLFIFGFFLLVNADLFLVLLLLRWLFNFICCCLRSGISSLTYTFLNTLVHSCHCCFTSGFGSTWCGVIVPRAFLFGCQYALLEFGFLHCVTQLNWTWYTTTKGQSRLICSFRPVFALSGIDRRFGLQLDESSWRSRCFDICLAGYDSRACTWSNITLCRHWLFPLSLSCLGPYLGRSVKSRLWGGGPLYFR